MEARCSGRRRVQSQAARALENAPAEAAAASSPATLTPLDAVAPPTGPTANSGKLLAASLSPPLSVLALLSSVFPSLSLSPLALLPLTHAVGSLLFLLDFCFVLGMQGPVPLPPPSPQRGMPTGS